MAVSEGSNENAVTDETENAPGGIIGFKLNYEQIDCP